VPAHQLAEGVGVAGDMRADQLGVGGLGVGHGIEPRGQPVTVTLLTPPWYSPVVASSTGGTRVNQMST